MYNSQIILEAQTERIKRKKKSSHFKMKHALQSQRQD